MHPLKIDQFNRILIAGGLEIERNVTIDVQASYLKGKGEQLLLSAFEILGGKGFPPLLEKLRFDGKFQRYVWIYDDEVHFNRYRLQTLKSAIYEAFTFDWLESYKRLCRTYEKECLKTGMQARIWAGPPLAQRVFGTAEVSGDLSGNGASGWKLNAYNDAQYDLLCRLHGYKLIRIPQYEHLMIGGSLKKIDDLLLQPKDEHGNAIAKWMSRKLGLGMEG